MSTRIKVKQSGLFRHILVGLVSMTGAAAVHAQSPGQTTPAEARATTLDSIVVSAQKRDESIMEVPLAISLVTGEDLLRENLVTLESFAGRMPGVVVSGGNTTDISIRGINTGNATSPTVAITIDDVPFGSTSWAGNATIPNLDPAEIERVEVLRGPQGTLYGASSLGGLIKYVTRSPDPNYFSGRVETGYSQVDGGSGGGLLRGSFNIPLVADRLGLRLSAYKRQDPEYADRYSRASGQLSDRNINSNDVDGFRAAARFLATENFVVDVAHLRQDTSSRNSAQTQLVMGTYQPLYDYFANDATGSQSDRRVQLTQLNLEWDLGDFTLKSVSGWGESRIDANSDSTASFGFVFNGIPAIGIPPVYPDAPAGSQVRLIDSSRTEKFSQELRISSNSADARVQWMLGAFYTDEESLLDQDMFAVQASGERIGPVVAFPLPSTFEEKAVFGDVTVRFTDRFDLKLGARYSENDQTYQANQAVAPSAEALFGPSSVGAVAHSSDDAFTWQVSPRFQLTDDVMLYARAAKGYRPGGPNSAIAPQATFAPDTVVNAELGLKGTFLDNRLILDTSLFNIDWDDVQLGATTPAGVSYFTNGGSARSRGLEVATTLVPAYNWKITASATTAEATLRDPLPVSSTGNYLLGAVGDNLPYTAEFSANLGVEKSWDIGSMLLTLGGNYTHLGDRDSAFRSSGAIGDRREKLIAPSYDLIDGFLRLEGDAWDTTLFVRNLTDERGIRSIGDGGGVSSLMSASFLHPRTVGVSFSYSF